MDYNDYLFRGEIEELDPAVAKLIQLETARQTHTLIMIPSESTIPYAVRSAVGSSFQNIYAEGYPDEGTRWMTEQEILDYPTQLADFRRNSDPRYYKGTEYANTIEALARRRAAEVFAANGFGADDLYVNVQPLSGAPANSAVYTALIQPGDTILSMNLMMGGHLSHGAPVNRAGKIFNIVSYTLNPETEQIDYDQIRALAQEHRPQIIIGGYSSYPIEPDWQQYREIADSVGAYFLADVAHFAGLIAAGVYPNPVGIADIVTFTTHKTLNGPRGAVIITHRKDLQAKLDRGVFPGEQGGPHMNAIAGLAVALRLARTEQFIELQQQTIANARAMARRLTERGLKVPHGGTDSHMLVMDCSNVVGEDGTKLSGDMAARLLDLIGIVCNRQTIPGDTSALRPSGIRLGTPWITQRGFDEARTIELTDVIADVILNCKPFSLMGRIRPLARTKIDFDLLQNAKLRVRDLINRSGIDTDVPVEGYPHIFYIDDIADTAAWHTLRIHGSNANEFLQYALTSDVNALSDGESQSTALLEPDGHVMSYGQVTRIDQDTYQLQSQNSGRVVTWLRSLSDAFVTFDPDNLSAKLPGPVIVDVVEPSTEPSIETNAVYAAKAYCIGMNGEHYAGYIPPTQSQFDPTAYGEPSEELLTTPLHDIHLAQNAKMAPFAGYDMPLWYDSVSAEHEATRNSVGLFDVAHMGIFELEGTGAHAFLQSVATNDVYRVDVGESHYSFLLDVNGNPLDDMMLYRVGTDRFIMVVNASNNDKNWAWLNSIKNGEVAIDTNLSRRVEGTDQFKLRDLRAESSGDDRLALIALQGPTSRDILLKLIDSEVECNQLENLPWASIMSCSVNGTSIYVSRTGYTGERVAYEIFAHPHQIATIFQQMIDLGATPCGLAARDSLRIEAGLPLYGNELAGNLQMNPADAGMGTYVKLYKPFFIGKQGFLNHERGRKGQVSRFQIENPKSRPCHTGDPIVDDTGVVVGIVTSAARDTDGNKMGMALMARTHRKRGTKLGLYPRAKVDGVQLGGTLPDQNREPEPITIISRFPKRKK